MTASMTARIEGNTESNEASHVHAFPTVNLSQTFSAFHVIFIYFLFLSRLFHLPLLNLFVSSCVVRLSKPANQINRATLRGLQPRIVTSVQTQRPRNAMQVAQCLFAPQIDNIIQRHWLNTSSTAQGGGGSFKKGKPIGEVGCCESRMAERIHWWTERWLELWFLEWLQWLQWSPHHNCWM